MGYHQGNADFSQVQDRRQLPDFTPAFVSNLSDDAIVLLGEMVKPSLGVGDEADAAVLGQQWVDDVTATCSRLKLATTRTDSVRRMTDCV